jgi:broad specificity phosphatase PhoE
LTTLVLIRHGQTEWNVEGRWQGQADPPLNKRGLEEAHQAAQALDKFKFVALYSSDLRRASETARTIGAEIGLPVTLDPRLREVNLGHWQGMLAADIQKQYPEEFRLWHESPLSVQPPGGEDVSTLAVRVLEAVNEIVVRHPGQRVGVASHELPIAVVLCRSAGLGLEHLRSMIPQTGQWHEVVLDGVLK